MKTIDDFNNIKHVKNLLGIKTQGTVIWVGNNGVGQIETAEKEIIVFFLNKMSKKQRAKFESGILVIFEVAQTEDNHKIAINVKVRV